MIVRRALITIVLGVLGTTSLAAADDVDLLADGSVASMAGVIMRGDRIVVDHRGFSIVEQTGGGGLPNPPYNLAGAHLRVDGGFEITVGIHDRRGEAAVMLAGAPPIVYDEFVNNRGSLRVALGDGSLRVGLVAPDSRQQLAEEQHVEVALRTDATISVRRDTNGDLTVTLDGVEVATIPEHDLFSTGEVWLGLDAASAGGSFALAELSARSVGDAAVVAVGPAWSRVAETGDDGLDDLAGATRPGFTIGAAMSLAPLAADERFAEVALGEFGSLTTENALKAQFVHPQPGVYDFAEADALVELARARGMAVHGHTLVFGEANPRWMQDLARDHPEQMEALLVEHVTTIVRHYRGRIATWDVVNEPLADDDKPGAFGLRRNIWLESIGPDYIAIALRAAHEADPEARLFINEFGLEADGERWDTFRALLSRLVEDGVPLDGVGLQSHVYEPGDEIEPTELRAVFGDLAGLGLTARISELDVHAANGRDMQAEQYATVLVTCLADPVCESLTIWGVSEGYGSTSYLDDGVLRIGDGLPWDQAIEPLPAVDAMRTAINSQ